MAIYKSKRVQGKKKVKVVHDKVLSEGWLSKVLFPIGFKYNENLQSLRKGDIIQFADGGEHYVWRVLRVSLKNAMLDTACWEVYKFGIDRAIELWHDRLRATHQDIKVMSQNECLVVYYLTEEVKYIKVKI